MNDLLVKNNSRDYIKMNKLSRIAYILLCIKIFSLKLIYVVLSFPKGSANV